MRNTLHLPGWIVNQMEVVPGVFHHPAFLYESMWSLLGLLLMFVLRRQSFLRVGELLMFYFIWYSLGRFYIEALRTDSLAFQGPAWLESMVNGLWSPMTVLFQQGYLDPAYGNVRISQIVAIVLVLLGIAFIVIRRAAGMATVRYNDPIRSTKAGKSADTATADTKATARIAGSETDPKAGATAPADKKDGDKEI